MNPRTRRFITVLFWFLASVGVLASTVAVWAHRTVLTTDGWTNLTSAMLDDPEVVAGTSQIITQQVAEAIDLEKRISDFMPGPDILAQAMTDRVEGAVAGVIAQVMSTDQFATLWEEGNRIAHEAAMGTLRGGGEVVSTEGGAIELNAFPLIVSVLQKLQADGLVPADWQLPPATAEGTAEAIAALESATGRDLPDDLGTITILRSERLVQYQSLVRTFDLIVLVLIVLTVLFAGLALYFSARRLRMVGWLALGAVGGLALARLVSRTALSELSGALADGPEGDTIRGVLTTMSDSVTWFAAVITGIAVGVLLAVLLLEWRARRRTAMEAASGAAGAEGVAGADTSARGWVRAHAGELSVGGLFVIAFVGLWRAAGPDVALPAAVIAGAWLGIVWLVARRDEPGAGPTGAGAAAATAGEAASGAG